MKYRKPSILLLIFCSIMLLAQGNVGYIQPVYSPDGQKILLSKMDHEGIYCFDKTSNEMYEITASMGSGYKVNWSYDGSKIAFKMISPEKGQAPVILDLASQKLLYLAPYTLRCGVPFFASDGKISFSIDQEIFVLNPDYTILARIPVENYANLCVISPNSKWIAYNDENDSIWLASLENRTKIQATKDEQSYFSPIFSPDGESLLVSTLSGTLKVISISSMEIQTLDEGENPVWMPDGKSVVYSKKRIESGEMINSDLYQIECATGNKQQLTRSSLYFESHCAYDSNTQSFLICDQKSGKLYTSIGSSRSLQNADLESSSSLFLLPTPKPLSCKESPSILNVTLPPAREESRASISGVPYIHQVYDTPNWFNGNWACGATSATMAMTYYKLLANWDCTVSVPYSHVSHFGRYICEVYTYNGYTFNKMTADASNKAAYGGYGYICQNNWENTKSHMAEYLKKHGVGSSVDWSPSWAKVQSEINNKHPFVILNALTSSGHYILGIGYYNNQHTVIVNDPYGNKNLPGYPNYKGADSSYDWPGYNNGYKNLNNVSCFIYARK